jgi:hAT family C-terminal dimerisation region
MDILPIPGSAVPCERVFSSSKRTTTDRRNKLGPRMVEALQLLKYQSKHGGGLNFTKGFDRDEEMEELEGREEENPVEDLRTFFRGLYD